MAPDALQAGGCEHWAHGGRQHDLARRDHADGSDGAAHRGHAVAAAIERRVRHAQQTAGEDGIAQGDGLQIADFVLALLPQGAEDPAGCSGFDGQFEFVGNIAAAHFPKVVHEGRVEPFKSRKALNLVQDGFDLFVFELERFQLLVDEITDLDDIGDSARVVAAHHLPGEAPQPARMTERFHRVMQEGGLGQRLCGDSGTAAEFDGESGGPSTMRLFSGMVGAHQNTII